MPRPTAASPGQERLVKQISDSDQSCTGNNAIPRENAGNNKEQGDELRGRSSQSRGMAQLRPIQGQCRLRHFGTAGPGIGRLRRSGKRHEGRPGPEPPGGESPHKVAHRLIGQERGATDKHDQAKRPHPEARADSHVEHNGPGQHQGSQAGSPDEDTEEDFPEHRQVGDRARGLPPSASIGDRYGAGEGPVWTRQAGNARQGSRHDLPSAGTENARNLPGRLRPAFLPGLSRPSGAHRLVPSVPPSQ
jgi:hypothetical protein